jgi:hypothetical protein
MKHIDTPLFKSTSNNTTAMHFLVDSKNGIEYDGFE